MHLLPNHPLGIISKLITSHFDQPPAGTAPAAGASAAATPFRVFDHLDPFVSVKRNFDDLLVPADHVSRRRSDTFYTHGAETVLRTHTSAHQSELLEAGHDAFLVVGDVVCTLALFSSVIFFCCNLIVVHLKLIYFRESAF